MGRQPLVISLVLGGIFTPVYAANLEAFAGAIGGNSTCVTFGPPAQVGSFFGSVGFVIGNIGNGVSDCGLAGGFLDINLPGGLATSTSSVIATVTLGTYTGTASASANYGVTAASASGTMGGVTGPLALSESSGFGLWEDNLTYTSSSHSNGSSGTIIYTFTIHGSLTTPVPNPPFASEENAFMVLKQDQSSAGAFFTARAGTGQIGTILGNPTYPGFTTGIGFVTGTGTFSTAALPFIWGTAVDLKAGLIVGSFPFTGGTTSADFLTTSTLTGIQVFASNGQPVSDFSIASSSGAQYSASGIVSEPVPGVPEPATFLPAAVALAYGLHQLKRKSRRSCTSRQGA